MPTWKVILLFFVSYINSALADAQSHLILKNDFNRDGIADRTIFASYGISGYFQSTSGNQQIDTFYLKQGARTIFYTSSVKLGGPYLKLTEDAGFFTVISLLKPQTESFKHTVSFIVTNKTYFLDDPFANPFSAASEKVKECPTSDAFHSKATNESLSWVDAINKYSTEETVRKSIDPECKSVFGDTYPLMEEQIISACGVGSGKSEKNKLVSCLDQNEETRRIGGRYKTALAENIFADGFKISCAKSNKNIPLASLNSTTKNVSIFQVTPENKNRNFKADFFHEMMHASGIKSELETSSIIQSCIVADEKCNKKIGTKEIKECVRLYGSDLTMIKNALDDKDGIPVNIPATAKVAPQTSVASAINEGVKTLDSNFSMDNDTQYRALSSASKSVFGSFSNTFKAAYDAAIPTAFAQGTIGNATATAAVPFPTTKSASSSRTIASAPSSVTSGAIYDVSSLPESQSASDKGELGSGLTVQAEAVKMPEESPRSPASARAGEIGAGTRGSFGGLASVKTTDRPDLRNNVPQLIAEEDFMRTLTSGKYAEVKARLTDPKNQKILEAKKIQYVSRDKTLGSKTPAIILKDLGNKFSIVRITIE
jgi:hypothetical protein